jgi:hypothetical protein
VSTMRPLGYVPVIVYLTFFFTLIAVLFLGIVLGVVWSVEDAVQWMFAHIGWIFLASAVVAVAAPPLLGWSRLVRAAEARAEAAAVDLQAARERLARGEVDGAEALANKVLLGARTEAERAAALYTLADAAELRGDFGREEQLLVEAWDAWPKLTDGVADVERATLAKRAFAAAAQGKLDVAERLLPQRSAGEPTAVELRARALVLGRRAAWGELDALLAAVDIEALEDAGRRSKLLLSVLRARAQGKIGGSAYRAYAAPDETADPEARAWVARALGT